MQDTGKLQKSQVNKYLYLLQYRVSGQPYTCFITARGPNSAMLQIGMRHPRKHIDFELLTRLL